MLKYECRDSLTDGNAHLSILMVDKQIPHMFVLHEGDLQTMHVTDLLRLENCIQFLHGDDRFGDLGLGFIERIEEQVHVSVYADQNTLIKEQLTSSFMKYLRVKSFRDRRKVLFRNCLLSLPFFHSVDSNWSGLNASNK